MMRRRQVKLRQQVTTRGKSNTGKHSWSLSFSTTLSRVELRGSTRFEHKDILSNLNSVFFQPMAFTFGLCGPLALSPSDAVVIDSCYNGGFMCGRLVSALIAAFIRPR